MQQQAHGEVCGGRWYRRGVVENKMRSLKMLSMLACRFTILDAESLSDSMTLRAAPPLQRLLPKPGTTNPPRQKLSGLKEGGLRVRIITKINF
jgi:hypothetical protein